MADADIKAEMKKAVLELQSLANEFNSALDRTSAWGFRLARRLWQADRRGDAEVGPSGDVRGYQTELKVF